jgi:uracil-DNA glycosylase
VPSKTKKKKEDKKEEEKKKKKTGKNIRRQILEAVHVDHNHAIRTQVNVALHFPSYNKPGMPGSRKIKSNDWYSKNEI